MALDRRSFVISGITAAAYSRIAGANDRLRVAMVGPGSHGVGLVSGFHRFAGELNAEMVAVCDLWTRRREAAAWRVKELSGREPAKLRHYDEVLELKDLDAVIIATPDHQHSKQLIEAVRTGKDVYLEQPLGNVLTEVKAAYRAVRMSKQVVQLGTQAMSNGAYQSAREFVRTGKLGAISRVSHEAGANGPRWRPLPAVKEIREHDTDWKGWLQGRRDRPFDPQLYFEFRLYREFSNGIADQWLTHTVAGVHHVMDEQFPLSVVANGGVMLYKDGRQNSDTFHASFLYPKGFIFEYSAMFGNDYPGHTRYYGQNGTLIRGKGGDVGYLVTPLGGGNRLEKVKEEIMLKPLNPTHHMRNWLECLRTRDLPTADVMSGYSHSVASMMAARAERTGKRIYWDAKREEIVDRPVAA